MAAQTLADILVEQGALSRTRADQLKIAEVQTGKSQEEIIRSQKVVSNDALAKAKAAFYNVPYIDLAATPVNPAALAVLPQEVATKFKIFPVSIDKASRELGIAMADPLNLTAIEFIEQKTGMHVRPKAADPDLIEEYVATRYETTLSQEVTQAMKEVAPEADRVKTLDVSQRTGVIRQEKIGEIVSHILDFAMRARASDVHIEPQEASTRVRYRIDGILQEKLTIPKELHDALISRVKILSDLKIDEKRIPQDGRFNFKNKDAEVDLRVSTLPTSWGEKVVMRLLKKSGAVPELQDLGLRGKALKDLNDAILRPHGIVIICGPTGSGKTTTLYSLISRINTTKVNIVTLEDPIEYKIAGVNQVQINPGAGLTFASGLRSFLRQDPNIILVGEIRDKETAELAIQASLTGHLVFSTLHTNDASGAIPRLLDMGAEPFLLASSITAVVAQRVMRRIDDKTKEEYDPDPKIKEDMVQTLGNLWPTEKSMKLYRGKPTPENNNTGYLGRIGIFEEMTVNEKISKLILERAPALELDRAAREAGMVSMKQDGYLKALEGLTTLEEVLRVAQE